MPPRPRALSDERKRLIAAEACEEARAAWLWLWDTRTYLSEQIQTGQEILGDPEKLLIAIREQFASERPEYQRLQYLLLHYTFQQRFLNARDALHFLEERIAKHFSGKASAISILKDCGVYAPAGTSLRIHLQSVDKRWLLRQEQPDRQRRDRHLAEATDMATAILHYKQFMRDDVVTAYGSSTMSLELEKLLLQEPYRLLAETCRLAVRCEHQIRKTNPPPWASRGPDDPECLAHAIASIQALKVTEILEKGKTGQDKWKGPRNAAIHAIRLATNMGFDTIAKVCSRHRNSYQRATDRQFWKALKRYAESDVDEAMLKSQHDPKGASEVVFQIIAAQLNLWRNSLQPWIKLIVADPSILIRWTAKNFPPPDQTLSRKHLASGVRRSSKRKHSSSSRTPRTE